MKIFITGGAGFIGSHIAEALLNKGYKITIYDNFSTGNYNNLKNFVNNERVNIIKGDILNYDFLEKSMVGHDFVSHFAAQLEIFLSEDDPEKDLIVNTVGTLNVLKSALKNKIKKVINSSSACVYGQTEIASNEDSNINPNWGYGVSKLAAEKYCKIFNDYKNLPVVSLRYSIVYGEREWFRRVLPIFIKQTIMGKDIVIFGKGDSIRDFIYVQDVVNIHNLCLELDVANGNVFNVGTGVPTSIEELANKIVHISQKNIKIIYEDIDEGEFSSYIKGKKRNIAELKKMLLNIDKTKSILGWEPSIDLEKGLRIIYNWAENNLDRWDRILSTKW